MKKKHHCFTTVGHFASFIRSKRNSQQKCEKIGFLNSDRSILGYLRHSVRECASLATLKTQNIVIEFRSGERSPAD